MADTYSAETTGDLRRELEAQLRQWPAVSGRRMFGCPSYFAGEIIFAVLIDGHIALTRLGEGERAALAGQVPVRPFAAGKRLVHRWAVVPFADMSAFESLRPFLEQSYRNALAEDGR